MTGPLEKLDSGIFNTDAAAHCINYENMQFNVYLGLQNIIKKDVEGLKIKVSKVIKVIETYFNFVRIVLNLLFFKA